MAYSFEIEGFSFSSNNHLKVETVKRWFTEGGFTVDKIKSKSIPDRHRLMIELSCWGHCPLAFDYWKARDLKQSIKRDYISNFKKGSVAEFWAKGADGDQYASKQVLDLTGWLI